MTIEVLRVAIESYPLRLYEALEAVDKAEKVIDRLNEQIEEEAELSSETADESDAEAKTESGQSVIEQQEILIKLNYELALLELAYEQIKGEIELEYRRNPPDGDKVTEATVTAFVKSNFRLVEAKERCLAKKFECDRAKLL